MLARLEMFAKSFVSNHMNESLFLISRFLVTVKTFGKRHQEIGLLQEQSPVSGGWRWHLEINKLVLCAQHEMNEWSQDSWNLINQIKINRRRCNCKVKVTRSTFKVEVELQSFSRHKFDTTRNPCLRKSCSQFRNKRNFSQSFNLVLLYSTLEITINKVFPFSWTRFTVRKQKIGKVHMLN